MAVCLGAEPVKEKHQPAREAAAPPRWGRPKKAELLEEAARLGINVPDGATVPQIARLLEDARG